MKKNILLTCLVVLLSLTAFSVIYAQNKKQPSVKEIKKQKQDADNDIKETQSQLGINEKKVTEGLAALRQLEDDIETSRQEIETAQGHLVVLHDTITSLEDNIKNHESDLTFLRDEYLKSVKKIRVARKRNSGMVFLFASKSIGEAKRRLRYMREFSAWKNRRTDEISNKVGLLNSERHQLVQAHEDVASTLTKETEAQNNLNNQRARQQIVVKDLQANSDALKSKLARRKAEARALGNQISQLIAEQQAKDAQEAAAKKKAEEDKRLAAQKAAEQQQRAQTVAPKKQVDDSKKQNPVSQKPSVPSKSQTETAKKPDVTPNQSVVTPDKGEYANARRRKSRATESNQAAQPSAPVSTPSANATPKNQQSASESGFGGMKGKLPKPVNGSFKIVSAFGVHPISPELPDILDENLGIDAHVASGTAACAVYEGDVIKIYDRSTTTGFRNIIVVKHGEYITVYANLETLAVKTGQHVTQGQRLGTVGADFDNPKHGMIHFELWKNQTRLDPAKWIRI